MGEKAADVIVIGSGIAGMAATAAAVQKGLSVTVLERASPEEYGGNTRYTEANMRMKSEAEVADDFEASFAANAGYNLDPNLIAEVSQPYDNWAPFAKAHQFPDPELISTLSANAGATLAWLKEFGIRFDHTAPKLLLTTSAPRIRPIGGGLALIEALSGYAREKGATFLYEHTAYKLLLDDDGTVAGVLARDNSGRSRTIHGRAVVLASGGFQGNAGMLAQYIGRRAEFIRPVARGGYFNKGEGIRMALEIGAAPAGDFGSYHAEPTDPRSRQANAVVYIYPYGILVNARAERFIDEAPGPVDNNYDHISRTIAEQPKGIAYAIYDQRVNDVPGWQRSIKSEHPAIQADTLKQLAERLEIPGDALERTVARYNAACVPNAPFSPLAVDGLSTRDLDPPKTNWARPIDRGPYSAFPVMSANCFTFGGLKCNSRAQVLDCDGRPILGLYAAGEAMGLYHQVYTGATSVLRGAVFGRIAGQTIAARMNS